MQLSIYKHLLKLCQKIDVSHIYIVNLHKEAADNLDRPFVVQAADLSEKAELLVKNLTSRTSLKRPISDVAL